MELGLRSGSLAAERALYISRTEKPGCGLTSILARVRYLLSRQCRPDHQHVPREWAFGADITQWVLPKRDRKCGAQGRRIPSGFHPRPLLGRVPTNMLCGGILFLT